MKASQMVKALTEQITQWGDLDVILVVDNVTRERVRGGQVNVDTHNIDVERGDENEIMITGDAEND